MIDCTFQNKHQFEKCNKTISAMENFSIYYFNPSSFEKKKK